MGGWVPSAEGRGMVFSPGNGNRLLTVGRDGRAGTVGTYPGYLKRHLSATFRGILDAQAAQHTPAKGCLSRTYPVEVDRMPTSRRALKGFFSSSTSST